MKVRAAVYFGLSSLFARQISADPVRLIALDGEIHQPERAAVVERRQTANVTIPAPVVVATSPYWEGNDGPWSSFAFQIGKPAQNVRLFPATAATNTWAVISQGCPDGSPANCQALRGSFFNSNQSLTWVPNSIFGTSLEVNLGMEINGQFGFDTLTLGWQGDNGPTLEHSIVAGIAADTYWLGLFGLNPRPTNFTTFNNPQVSYMQQLKNTNKIPSVSWSYTAGAPYRFSKVFGSLVLGGYDTSRFATNNLSFPFYEDIQRDLLVTIQSISTTSASDGSTVSLLSAPMTAFIDSTVPYMWLPLDACQKFENAFGLVWNVTKKLYLVNDTLHSTLLARNASVTFTLGTKSTGGPTVDIVLPYGAFDLIAQYPLVANDTRYFPLKRATNDTQYTLGRTFLQEAYLIADYERLNFTVAPCAWHENAVQHIVAIPSVNSTTSPSSNSSPGSSFPAGAIAGVVVGIVVLIALVALVLFCLRRKRAKKRKAAELEDTSWSRPNGSDHSDAKLVPTAVDGELDSGAVHEMFAPHKQAYHEMHAPYKTDLPAEMGGNGSGYFEGNVPGRTEVEGSTPVFEMPGSEAHEMTTLSQFSQRGR
ncbi:hypothetical protein B0A49_02254 [Cryomyces minteri]|uniref:Peptidase A1 domain-containing protein n=2 Tax=Cryomyces minteri TaxID=331657 RepID=A0A4U0XEY3_9PEZI|nr:hypothetical protein B0A49_02254 [Cryomyces minteri]